MACMTSCQGKRRRIRRISRKHESNLQKHETSIWSPFSRRCVGESDAGVPALFSCLLFLLPEFQSISLIWHEKGMHSRPHIILI